MGMRQINDRQGYPLVFSFERGIGPGLTLEGTWAAPNNTWIKGYDFAFSLHK
jgi:hypothetical protein